MRVNLNSGWVSNIVSGLITKIVKDKTGLKTCKVTVNSIDAVSENDEEMTTLDISIAASVKTNELNDFLKNLIFKKKGDTNET